MITRKSKESAKSKNEKNASQVDALSKRSDTAHALKFASIWKEVDDNLFKELTDELHEIRMFNRKH